MQFSLNENYPTRIREPGDAAVQKPGFINLLEVTATAPDSLKNYPFLLSLNGHKVFILRRRFNNNDQTLRIWFIAIDKTTYFTLDSVETEEVEILTTRRLVLTIETEEETADSAELDVAIVDKAP
jgi:hypothetical protein